jgi:cytochrome c biogenesis factor
MTPLGELSLWIALLMAIWGTALSAIGGALSRSDLLESGTRGLRATSVFTALAFGGLAWAFLSADFSVQYVALHVSDELPPIYRLSALWAGRPGWVLLWDTAFSMCVAFAIGAKGAARWPPSPLVSSTLGVMVTVSLSVSALAASPFQRLAVVPANGRGLERELQDWTRVVDAPLVAVGVAAASIWLTLGIAAFAAGERRAYLRDKSNVWALLVLSALAAATGAQVYWNYAHRGIVPALNAPFQTLAGGTSFVVFLAGVAIAVGSHERRDAVASWLAAAGAIMLVVGSVAASHAKRFDVELRDGETLRVSDAWGSPWTFTSQGTSRIERPGYLVTAVALLPMRDGVRQPFMSAEVRESTEDTTRERTVPDIYVAIRGGLTQDVSVSARPAPEGRAALRIQFAPLVSCVWLGGVLLVLSGLFTFRPKPKRGVSS